MGGRPYPLEAARTVRGVARDAATDRLAGALDAQASAQARRERAAGALAEHRRAEDERLLREGARQPVSSAADLQRVERYRARQRTEELRLEEALKRAEEAAREATRAVDEARRALTTAESEAEVVERHQARWAASERQRTERGEDDEAEDGSSARR